MSAPIPSIGSRALPYVVLDVFTDRPFAGNPLAVVLDAEDLTAEQMQQIAREFNHSETAFPLAPTEEERSEGADYVLRIFTPEVELPFAGHPSVGSAWWLGQLGRIPQGVAYQKCGAGLLPVEVSSDSATLTGGKASVGDPIDGGKALVAVGLERDALADPDVRVASTGLPYAVLFVHEEHLARCRPDIATLREEFAHPRQATGVYVVAWEGKTLQARTRMFAGDLGSPEDPATGSAALALAARLVARGDFGEGQTTFHVTQGVEMGRPSLLTVTCDVKGGVADRLRVSGGAVLVSQGQISTPT
ncbi:MAG TPA: PhzF family phenazine biosynthesis protein [Actinomycetes bacterium]|nr:PhzF family phenazine biosynthesis protein [Actinomycetes bacterium]